ncbi:UBA-like protein [Nannochloropsis gaditana]|uniref:UBA-like protein n=1 Tax=Nannochloropsis gaditana TaxID=72520 RepID=W7U8H6_9STRA|nr:UBA-like protein [Nannochloropsis gaditana]
MAHYPTLAYSTFKVDANGLPADLRVLPELDTTLPPAHDFELEEKVVKAYEDSQAAAERLVAQEASPVVTKPNGEDVSTPTSTITGGLGDLSLVAGDPEKKTKMARMKELTKADDKTCLFYLDSYSWDLQRACQEYFSK